LVLGQAGLRTLRPLQGACIGISSATLVFVLLSQVIIDFENWNLRAAAVLLMV